MYGWVMSSQQNLPVHSCIAWRSEQCSISEYDQPAK